MSLRYDGNLPEKCVRTGSRCRHRESQTAITTTKASTAAPATTPPAIGPVCDFPDEEGRADDDGDWEDEVDCVDGDGDEELIEDGFNDAGAELDVPDAGLEAGADGLWTALRLHRLKAYK